MERLYQCFPAFYLHSILSWDIANTNVFTQPTWLRLGLPQGFLMCLWLRNIQISLENWTCHPVQDDKTLNHKKMVYFKLSEGSIFCLMPLADWLHAATCAEDSEMGSATLWQPSSIHGQLAALPWLILPHWVGPSRHAGHSWTMGEENYKDRTLLLLFIYFRKSPST